MTKRLVNIMPMAGEGKRFKKGGYKTPKPLIDINGEPMFVKSAKCMPSANLWIFIIKEELLENTLFKNEINKNFKNIKIITVNQVTEGQASTCFLAKKYLQKNDQIFISSCDNCFELNNEDYIDKSKKYDVLVFTTKSNKIHMENPSAFGWVKKDNNGQIEVSCKKQISSTPIKDRIIVGSFFFKNLNFFQESLESLFKKKNKINNEYYLDMAIAEALSLGLHVGEVIVKNYIGWGSYTELKNWEKNKFI